MRCAKPYGGSANFNISVLNEATLHTQLFDIFENPNDFFS